MRVRAAVILGAAAALFFFGCQQRSGDFSSSGVVDGWTFWGGDQGGAHFSANTQITPGNVRSLRVAWTYHTKDLTPPGVREPTGFQATPILADGTLYLCSPRNRIIALDPETGQERWVYDAKPQADGGSIYACRGVSFYRDAAADPMAPCAHRIFSGTNDGRLVALDAKTGRKCGDFGADGEVDLTVGLGRIERPGHYGVSSPPTIVGDRVIVGSKIADFVSADMPGGVVRAFNARTGALEWAWTGAPPGAPAPADGTYPRSTPNVWAPMSADVARRLVFLPTGNPNVDWYSANRNSLDYYGSSVVALNADSGALVWRYQFVHHDIWDYDTPAQPLLFDLDTPNGPIPALAQATKMGHIFVLDRTTGRPIFPIDEQPVPAGGVTPDFVSRTQPIPRLPEPLRPTSRLTEDDIWGFTFIDRNACLRMFRSLRHEGLFTPVSEEATLIYPFTAGGSNWGGLSWDPRRRLLIANTTNVAGTAQMAPRTGEADRLRGTPYTIRTRPFLSPWGAPCNKPPWGRLAAIDMRTGRKAWDVPLGTTRDQAPWPLWFRMGVPNQGGTLTTASGLIFIAATTDRYLRAFATDTGRELWKARLPAGGQATPMTYRLSETGRQYVVIAAGGHAFLRTKHGDSLIAYALPCFGRKERRIVLREELQRDVQDISDVIGRHLGALLGRAPWRGV